MRELGRKATHHTQQRKQHKRKHSQLPCDRLLSSKLLPIATSIFDVALERLGTELVVHEPAERDAVAEELRGCDGSAPDEDGGCDEEDAFEDAAEGEDEGGGFADLDRPC